MEALVIEIKPVTRKHGCLKFSIQITEQVLRGSNASYLTSNNFQFFSMSLPAVRHKHNTGYVGSGSVQDTLYLRGSERHKDNVVMYTTSVGYIERLKKAIVEYNEAKASLCDEQG